MYRIMVLLILLSFGASTWATNSESRQQEVNLDSKQARDIHFILVAAGVPQNVIGSRESLQTTTIELSRLSCDLTALCQGSIGRLSIRFTSEESATILMALGVDVPVQIRGIKTKRIFRKGNSFEEPFFETFEGFFSL
ncbi:MAG TPA: hypothetical protein VNJ01_13830 [Bacteriovoracaceae bacterium]|nr:hypothetical protein [Bacteriovoracaceae bacterium]